VRCLAAAPHAKVVPGLSCAAARPSGRSASHRNDGSGEWHVISGKAVALPVYRVAILARAGGSAWPAGPAYEARAIPAGAPGHRHTASRRAKRRVARVPRRGAHRVWPHPHGVHGTPGALPEPLGVVQDFDLQHLARRPTAASPVKIQPVHLLDRRHPNGQAGPGGECASAGW